MSGANKINNNNFAILMAGGVGSRFWPVSTSSCPKQFRDLLGAGETLIQTTFKRLKKLVPVQNIFVLTNESYETLVHDQLPEVNDEQIILEPAMRNTAPAVLVAALKIKKLNPQAVMIMAPSDHWIENEDAFVNDISLAFEAVRHENKIITLGIQPTFPNTGYGYIQYETGETNKLRKVHKFTEKPNFQLARNFLEQGNFLWNAGIFIWNVNFILASFRENLREMYDLFTSEKDIFNTPSEKTFIHQNYSAAENISIDFGILEKEKDSIFVILATFDWNDLGTWGSLYQECQKDDNENVVLNARLLAMSSSGNIVTTTSNKIVVADGLKDYIIVDEKEVLMIVPKEKEQEIKEIRKAVQKKYGENLG